MKAKDLRIGNYVNDFKGDVKQLNEITGVFEIAGVRFESEMNLPITLHISPIPLTEEWLEKLGFEKALNGWWDESENWCCNNNDFYLGAKMFLAKVDYVHQLQNLYFALNQKELSI